MILKTSCLLISEWFKTYHKSRLFNWLEISKFSAELKARPLDVGVHIRLLCLYLETGRTKTAYNHAIELESRQAFNRNLAFYECLAKVCDVSTKNIVIHIVRECLNLKEWLSPVSLGIRLIYTYTYRMCLKYFDIYWKLGICLCACVCFSNTKRFSVMVRHI